MSTLTATVKKQNAPSALRTILLAWMVAGILDILAAITMAKLLRNVPAERVLQSVSSGFFGREAYTGGTTMALYGLAFHFLIALIFSIIYFLIFPYIKFLRTHKVLSGLLYGILVWVIMNLVVLPLSNFATVTYKWAPVARGMIILMLCIGLPISLIVHHYYTSKENNGNGQKT